MSDYIVSARKYRPDSFESLIGQDNIARTLKNSILRGQLAHAYLFCGPRGVGKTSAARIFAKTINCSHPTADMDPCGECESCLSFKEGRSYCIHELDAASNNGVDDIKALMDQVQIPPQVGRYSVYIIDEVHMLSQSAFNAFLKTLEEPPAHAIFILATTEKHKIIPTILSRCQTYDFNRISIPDIVRNLKDIAARENITIDDESLHIIAGKADGAMRDALTIFDQTVAFCGTDIKCEDVMHNLNVLDYEYSFTLVDAFLRKDYGTALLTFDEVLSKGFNAIHFVSSLGSHLRDLLVSRTGGLDALLDLPDSLKQRYREQAERCSVKFLYDALGIVKDCESGYRASVNQRLHIEYALMKLSFLAGAPQQSVAAAPEVPVQKAGAAMRTAPEPQVPASQPAPAPADPVQTPAEQESAPRVEVAPAVTAAPGTPVPGAPAPEAPVPDTPAAPDKTAAATAPATPTPAPSETRRRRAVKTGASLSLSSLLNEEEMVVEPVETVSEEALPDDSRLTAIWKEFALATPQPRLANALSNAVVSIRLEGGNKIVEFSVTNEAQKKWIEEQKLRELEDRFCKLAGSGRIRLVPTVAPAEVEENRIYMPGEKAEDLMSKNPEVRDLVIDLGLEIN